MSGRILSERVLQRPMARAVTIGGAMGGMDLRLSPCPLPWEAPGGQLGAFL